MNKISSYSNSKLITNKRRNINENLNSKLVNNLDSQQSEEKRLRQLKMNTNRTIGKDDCYEEDETKSSNDEDDTRLDDEPIDPRIQVLSDN